ncbi:MAG: DUF1232 domain-containing protein [Myxococcota bacterium]
MADEPITIELNPREQRVYERFRSRVREVVPGSSTDLRDMLLLLPDFTVLLSRLLRDRRVPRTSKLVALVGIGYVLSPIDVLPALLLGPIGLIDDFVVVTAALSRLINHVHPDVVRDHWPGQGDALAVIQRAAAWCEEFVTGKLGGWVRGRLGLS